MIRVKIFVDDGNHISYDYIDDEYAEDVESVKEHLVEILEEHPFIVVNAEHMSILINTKHIVKIEVKDVNESTINNNVDN